MNEFLKLDSKFYKYGTLLADLIILTMLWFLCCIPVITFGAATTGMYYVTTRQLSNREGYVTKDFFKSFKSNFLQATIMTVIFLIMAGIVLINIVYLSGSSILYPIQFVLYYEVTIVAIYCFPILSRFDMKTGQILKTAFFMANKHLLTTWTCLILLVAIVLICLQYPILIVLCAGVYAILTSMMFMKVFRKYNPEVDKPEPGNIY